MSEWRQLSASDSTEDITEELTIQEIILKSLDGEQFDGIEVERTEATQEIQRLKALLAARNAHPQNPHPGEGGRLSRHATVHGKLNFMFFSCLGDLGFHPPLLALSRLLSFSLPLHCLTRFGFHGTALWEPVPAPCDSLVLAHKAHSRERAECWPGSLHRGTAAVPDLPALRMASAL